MLKENWRLISRLERLGDFVIIVASFFAAYYGRSSLLYWNERLGWGLPFEQSALAPIRSYAVVLLIGLLSYGFTLNVSGSYSSMRLSSPFRLLRISVLSSVVTFITLAASLFLLKLDLSRVVIVLFCVLVALSLTAERYFVLGLLRYYRRRGRNFRNVVICGIGEQAVRFAHEVSRRPELGIRIRGFADLSADPDSLSHVKFRTALREAGYERPTRIIERSAGVTRSLTEYAVDEVIFTDVIEVMAQVEEIILVCSELGIRTTIVADLFSIGMVKSGISYFGGVPLIHFQTPPGDRWELAVKRVIDVAVSAAFLVMLSPIFLLIALLVKADSKGPVIFKQRRMGLNGRLFYLYKFRSMFVDSPKRLGELRSRNEMAGPVFKMKNDPRITRAGKFLRRFSLDELPQLLNVLRGEMSLVGPRPPMPGEVSLYERRDRRRLSMRPGITCTWQVSGRSDIKDFEAWVKLDLDYIDNWSLGRDLSLLVRTIPAVLFGTGAH